MKDMNTGLDELYQKFHDNEDFSPERLVQLIDSNRLALERQLSELDPSERLLEIFRDVAHGLAYTGRYAEAIPYAKACLSMYSTKELEEMGEFPCSDVAAARGVLIYSLFNVGRRSEALVRANEHLEAIPDDHWVRRIRDLIRIMKARQFGKWLWYVAGALLVLEVGIRLARGSGSLSLSLLGLAVVVSAFAIEKWAKRKAATLLAELDRIVPPIRIVR